MKVAAIGRTEILYESIERLYSHEHEIVLIVAAEEAPEYTKTTADFQLLAGRLKAQFLKTNKVRDVINVLKTVPPIDVGISVNYPVLIPQEVIDSFRLGILNAHGGDLPRYRGNACQAWAIINGESRVGLCIHRMASELDSGEIIARDYFPITVNTKVTQVWEWMNGRIPEMFIDAINRLQIDPHYVLERQPTDRINALRCYPRRPEDGRIDWQKSATEILRLINATNRPYSGAYCTYENDRLTIWDAELVEDDENFLAVPGQVTGVCGSHVEVATGKGKLRILLIEKAGNEMVPSKIIRSIRQRLG